MTTPPEPAPPTLPPPPTRGLKRRLYLLTGLLLVGIAFLGLFLPVLPTTPWLILASYCFARSSPRLEAWLRRTPYFGPLIADWERHRGIRPRIKATAITVVVLVIGSTILFSPAPVWAKWSAGLLGALGISVILFAVKTVREGPNSSHGQ